MDEIQNTTEYIVLIEWDGKKPPTTWYNRLKKFGLVIRGAGKDGDPTDRRRQMSGMISGGDVWKRDKGVHGRPSTGQQNWSYEPDVPNPHRIQWDGFSVVTQEGAIRCKSKALAQMLGALARHHGAAHVSVYGGEVVEATSTSDAAALKLEASLSKRGRKTANTFNWVVVCLDELKTYSVKDAGEVVVCPNCKSPQIKIRVGDVSRFAFPRSATAGQGWFATRFAHGSFEAPPAVAGRGKTAPGAGEVTVNVDREDLDAQAVASAPWVDVLATYDQALALRIMDAVFVARVFHRKADINDARIHAITKYFKNGGDPSLVNMATSKTPDIFDAAVVLGPDMAVGAFYAIYGKA